MRTRWQIAIRYSGLPLTTKAVAWALSTWWRSDARGGSVSLEDLSDASGLGRSTVARALGRLEGGGWITRIPGGGRGRRTAYSAAIPAEIDDRVEQVLNRRRGGTVFDEETVPLAGPFGAGNRPAGGTVSARKPSRSATETVPLDDENRPAGGTVIERAFRSLENQPGSGDPDGSRTGSPISTPWARYREALGGPSPEGGQADPTTGEGSPASTLARLRELREQLVRHPDEPLRVSSLRILDRQIAELEKEAHTG